ncbi:hypothetical protein [Deinococcus hopiensis]|uniref:Uncharacterized protein n=1 Tax=Deinococcus hopiensis KR-140 TaxID=695939 RepID=A0A1W1UB03_9DEIO|nr:hypothetical protein [Deinococcus hopiensis]SMB77954.1 hypothetical protein SAMN00790413_04025 [Deinococcus hopiensis KR-140]
MVVKKEGDVERSRALQTNPFRLQGTISNVPVTTHQAETGFYITSPCT